MIDISKILQLDYLKEFISKYNDMINAEKSRKIELYSLDIILSMDNVDITDLFTKYGLKCDSIIEKKDSDFLDDDWEFSDLFEEELTYASEEKKVLDTAAWNEVLELNKQIESYNEGILKAVSTLKEQMKFFELMIRILETNDLIYGDDINSLKQLILLSPLIDDKDRFEANLIIVNYLINNKKEIVFSKDNIKTEDFDSALVAVHNTSTYKPVKKDDSFKFPYQDKILKYYITYKNLIDDAGFSNVFELMEASNDVFVDLSTDYLSRDDFCFQLGSLLYQLRYINDSELEKEILKSLSELDSLYKIDKKNTYKKDKMISEIDVFFSKIEQLDVNLINKIRTRLKILKSDLNEIVNNERMQKLELEFNDIKRHMDNLTEILNLIKNVNEYSYKIINIFNALNLNNSDSELLSSLQNKLSLFEDEVLSKRKFEDVSSELYSCFKNIDEIQLKIERGDATVEQTEENINKFSLKGFVLCDFDEDNKSYLLSDLEPSSKNKMVDKSIEPKKVRKGYEDFNKLINDLFLLGNTERLNNNDSHGFNNDKVNDPVYWDTKNRTHGNETGMYRLKYDRNGVERFIEQKIVLHTDSVIYKQFVNIVKEIIPSVEFDISSDINLYINYASAMKREDDYLYNIAIKRFERKSPLYRIFNEPKNKTELSDKECGILKDIIHASLDAFVELEKVNPDFHVDVIKHIEEGRTRG